MKSIAVLISAHGPDEGQSPAEQCNVLCRKIWYFVFSIVKKCAAFLLSHRKLSWKKLSKFNPNRSVSNARFSTEQFRGYSTISFVKIF